MSVIVPITAVALAHRLADAAREVIRPYFRVPLAIDDKADSSPVTVADREAERVMREIVEAEAPSHGIIGEEHGEKSPDAEWVWVFDPIDGTKSFITGMPNFGTLIALLHRGVPVLGVIDQPIRGERWIGAVGHGSTFNDVPIKTRECLHLEQAALFTTDPDIFRGEDRTAYDRLEGQVKLKRYGVDCYAYGVLAMGFVDLVCESELKLYDYAALVPVIEQAGGVITDWAGCPAAKGGDGRILASGDARLHEKALAVLGGA